MSDLRKAAERALRWLDSEEACTADDAYAEERAIAEALRAELAQEQAEPEPVAWMYVGIKHDSTTHGPHLVWRPEYMDAMSASKGAKAKPLYAAPPQRAPLTVIDIQQMLCDAIERAVRSEK